MFPDKKFHSQIVALDEHIRSLAKQHISQTTHFTIPEDSLREIFESIDLSVYKRVFVCGAGTHTRLIWPILQEYFENIDGILDRESSNAPFCGVPCLARNDFVPQLGDLIVISSASYESEMYADIRELYGDSVSVLRLYSVEAWDSMRRFDYEASQNQGDWNEDNTALLQALGGPQVGAELNASGFGFILDYFYSYTHKQKFPSLELSGIDRSHLYEILNSIFEHQVDDLSEQAEGVDVILVETYALGNHVIRPVLELVREVLSYFQNTHIVIFISDLKSREFFSKHELDSERVSIIDWCFDFQLGYFLDDPSEERLKNLDRQSHRLPPRLKELYSKSHVEVMRGFRFANLYSEWIDKIGDIIRPKIWLNVLDNRPVSAAFYLSKLSKVIPTYQIQHGFISSVIGPFWANYCLGWKDAHSAGEYQKNPSFGCFLPIGNFYLNYLKKTYSDCPVNAGAKEERIFMFIFQGPPYWHVTHKKIRYALGVLKEAVRLMGCDWKFVIKLRFERGALMLQDFFSDMTAEQLERLEILLPQENSSFGYSDADAIGVLSSSAREEAAFYDLPLFSLEKKEDPSHTSFAYYGLSECVESGDALASSLKKLPKRDASSIKHRNEMCGDFRIVNALFERELHFCNEGEHKSLDAIDETDLKKGLPRNATLCFDIDGTLCSKTNGGYETAKPFTNAIEAVNRYYEMGHHIKLFTARGSTTGINWRSLTETQMKKWGVKYHELIMGKPEADLFIDDKAVDAYNWHANKYQLPGIDVDS